MKLINLTTGTEITNNVVIANTFISRLKGLLGRSEMPSDLALVIKPCNQVHMFFMRFPVLVVFVSKENQVLHIEKLMPWRVSKFVRKALMVIEMPLGLGLTVNIGGLIKIEKG